ncbi:DNA ligase, partial [Frankliniella fusca]
MIMSQASNVRSLQTFGKCRLRERTLWNKAMIFLSFFTSWKEYKPTYPYEKDQFQLSSEPGKSDSNST